MVVRTGTPSRLLLVSLAFTCLLANSVWAASAKAVLERNPIRFDETVRLIVEVDENVSNQSLNLDALSQDFVVRGTSTSSNTSIINGQTSTSTRWFVRLEPRREGLLQIPPVRVGSLQTNPLTLKVTAAGADLPGQQRDAFIEAEVQPSAPYVQAQLTYIAKLYVSANVINGSLGEPRIEPGSGDAVVQRVGEDALYEARRGDQRYRVVERRYAIFPQQSGELKIEPLRFQGQISAKSTSGVLNNQFLFSKEIETRSKAIRVQVKPRPAAFQGEVWLPLSDLTLSERWSNDPSTFRAGEPLTRTITVRAVGANEAQLPALKLADIDGMRIYPDQAETNTENDNQWVISVRTERLAFVPTKDGALTLPEISVPWWDTATDSLRHAVIPARELQVWPALAAKTTTSVATQKPRDSQDLGGDNNVGPADGAFNWQEWIWPSISFFLSIAWLMTLFALWRSKTRSERIVETKQPVAKQANLKAIKDACLKHDAKQVRKELSAWATMKWPGRSAMTSQDIARQLENQELARLLENLDDALYSENGTDWNGSALWECLQKSVSAQKDSKQHMPNTVLPDLHPAHT